MPNLNTPKKTFIIKILTSFSWPETAKQSHERPEAE